MKLKRLLLAIAVLLMSRGLLFAQQEHGEYEGYTNSDDINVRSDSTVSSESICIIDKGKRIFIVGESYDWYKIRLPRGAPAYVKKDLVTIDAQRPDVGSVAKDNVNIRLRADISSAILGKLKLKDRVRIIDQTQDWYRVDPTRNSFGWIHKKFVDKVRPKQEPEAEVVEAAKSAPAPGSGVVYEAITAQGRLKPKTMTGVATHKLIQAQVAGSSGKSLYLLKSDAVNLDQFNDRTVKVAGKIYHPSAKNPVIEVDTLEVIN